ncbi:hypothetical protein ACOSP7_023589 [Xanthoceras sorbifolium]
MSSSLSSLLLLLFTLTNTVLLHFLISSPVISCFHQSPNSPRGLLFEEKTRLGSMPPSCHNKCNQCHPCMAVQVPTLPSHEERQPQPGSVEFLDPSPLTNKYSNYKPLGWKCRCNDHFYNP